MSGARVRFGVVMATAGLALSALAGCASPDTATDAGAEDTPQSSAPAPAESPDGEAAGDIDCAAVGEAIAAWVEASFAGMSTEVTNAELAESYTAAADAHAAAAVPGAEDWETLGEVIQEYISQWSALPADGAAIEHIESVEEHVDDFAESRDFDNDDFDDAFPAVGEACSDAIEGMFEAQ